MSKEALPCAFCGQAPEIISATVITWARCGNKDCYIGGIMMPLHIWNRRFVCLGKNGKKLFNDSKFRVWSKDILCFVWNPDFLRWRTKWVDGKSAGESCDALFTCFEIELIESDGE